MTMRKADGFTLLEIVVGLLMVAVLGLAGMMVFGNYTSRAQVLTSSKNTTPSAPA